MKIHHNRRPVFLYTLILLVLIATILAPGQQVAHAQEAASGSSIEFALVGGGQGWLVQDDSLYWTQNNGGAWTEITPPGLDGASLAATFFIDAQTGWLVVSRGEPGALSFQIDATVDGGMTWNAIPLDLFSTDELSLLSGSVDMQWIDRNTGWLLFKKVSGVNFSSGYLVQTRDGGQSWQRLDAPLGEPFVFADANQGWMAGGPDGSHLYRTQDGGVSWTDIAANVPAGAENSRAYFYLPQTTNSAGIDGYLLPVLVRQDGAGDTLKLYWTSDQGESWSQQGEYPLGTEVDYQTPLPLRAFDGLQYIFFYPGEGRIVRAGEHVTELENTDGTAANLVQISMGSLDSGWGMFLSGECTSAGGKSAQQSCTTTTKLMSTSDSGVTWQALNLPSGGSEITSVQAFNPADTSSLEMAVSPLSTSNAVTFAGQGFDKCEIPSLAQMQTWIGSSPYRAVNLYIGGSSRACSNAALSAAYVSQLYTQGWKFIPTWIGPQAPCSGLSSTMSSDQATAYTQGVNEAISATAQLKNLGFTSSSGAGSVVYYDLESFNGDTACVSATQSFIEGWTTQLHNSGNLSGVYGLPKNLDDFFILNHAPDVIWPAQWFLEPGYRADASVWDIPYIDNSRYANHQRIRQYSGSAVETWGPMRSTIDTNVIDGVVAVASSTLTASCPATTATSAYVCKPTLTPAYSNNSCDTFWYPVLGYNNNFAYLTENVKDSGSGNTGKWQPNLLQFGTYRVEAYIASHASFSSNCTDYNATLVADTTHAQYSINSANGLKSVVIDQSAQAGKWVSLGEYDFLAGTSGYVALTDVTGETNYARNVNFGALRFILVSENHLKLLYLPIINR